MGSKISRHFETDGQGNIITKPVVGYAAVPIEGMAVLLGVRYVDSDEDLNSASSKQIQLTLTPQQALEIAGSMARQAKLLLESPPADVMRQ
jgi:hypothetical protein